MHGGTQLRYSLQLFSLFLQKWGIAGHGWCVQSRHCCWDFAGAGIMNRQATSLQKKMQDNQLRAYQHSLHCLNTHALSACTQLPSPSRMKAPTAWFRRTGAYLSCGLSAEDAGPRTSSADDGATGAPARSAASTCRRRLWSVSSCASMRRLDASAS